MDLQKLFGIKKSDTGVKFPREFPVKIERKTPRSTVQFDAVVKGYFVGRNGKPDFVANQITVWGIPEMNIRRFFPDELKEVTKFALSVEYPKLLNKKVG
jgi:hypothetical protein